MGTATLAVLDAGGEGLATFAVATDDISGDVRRLRDAGSPIREPVDGSRARPDGEVVRWRTAAAALGPCEPPFLIEHELTGAEWGVEARAARASFEHPVAGRARLTRLEVPCADPPAVAEAYSSTVGLELEAVGWWVGGAAGSTGPSRVRRPGRRKAPRRPLRRLARAARRRAPGDPVAMRGLAGVIVLAVVLGGCGGVDRVDVGQDTSDLVEPTPVPGGPTTGDIPVGVPGAVGPQPASNPDRVGAAVPIAAGIAATGPWGVWAYRQKDGSLCIEYVGGNSGGAACGDEQGMLSPSVSISDRDGFITGGTAQPTAVSAVIRFADGTTATAPLVIPGTLSTIGARYYAAAIPATGNTVAVDIVDAAGTVLETTTLNTR